MLVLLGVATEQWQQICGFCGVERRIGQEESLKEQSESLGARTVESKR